MGKLRSPKKKLLEGVRTLAQGVQTKDINPTDSKEKQRLKPLGKTAVSADDPDAGTGRKTDKFSTIQVSGSKGQTYTITIPTSYVRGIPTKWEWNEQAYLVAELIAQGIPIAQIPDDPKVNIRSRMTIYCWLEHPEFREHIDGLVLETGWTNRRERMNNMKRLNDLLFTKVVRELDKVKLTDKSLGAVLSAITANSKLIAQEKGEFVEESRVQQDTNITGTVVNVTADVEQYLNELSEDERKQLEREFDDVGDSVIRSLTGNKD